MKHYFAKYTLSSDKTAQPREGALLKIETPYGFGYSDLHPWPIFGEPSLEQQLDSIKNNQPHKKAKKSLQIAQWDAKARQEKKYLLNKADHLHNHYLIEDISQLNNPAVKTHNNLTLKIKVGKDLVQESVHLEKLTAQNPNFKLRLDFNIRTSFDEIGDWLNTNKAILPHIEFLEDPCPYDATHWSTLKNQFRCKLALDWAGDPEQEDYLADIIVIKPAGQNIETIINKHPKKQFVLTHSMDHPLGQTAAIYEAQYWKKHVNDRILACGLTPMNFNNVASYYNEMVNTSEQKTGFGFNQLLASEKWTAL